MVRTSRLISWLFISLFLISGLHEMNARSATTQPDFAFPQKVSDQAEKGLKTALRDSDGPGTLRAIMDYGLAQGLVGADNLPSVISRIQDLRSNRKVADPTRAMLALLQATVYRQIYTDNRWNFDRRELPLTPLPQSYNEWSGEQFRHRIQGLVDTALSYSAELKPIRSDAWREVIDLKDADARCFPSLYDFVAYRAINLLRDNGTVAAVFPINWLCRYTTYEHLHFPYASPISRQILGLYQELIRLHTDNPYALIYADVERLGFVNNYVAERDSADVSIFDRLMQLYQQYADCDFSAYALREARQYAGSIRQQQQLYDNAGQFLSHHPEAGTPTAYLKSLRKAMERESVTADYPGTVVPGASISVKLQSTNAISCAVGLFRIPADAASPADTHYYRRKGSKAPALISMQSVSFPHGHTLFQSDTTITFTVPSAGRYVIAPLLYGNTYPEQQSAAIVQCTSIALISGTNVVMALDPITGAPLQGVKVALYDYKNQVLKSTMTGSDGLAHLPRLDRVAYITGSKDDDNLSVCRYSSSHSTNGSAWSYGSRIFTDLPIYHPGDTVSFSGIVYRYNKNSRELCPGMNLKVSMLNANRQATDTLQLSADSFGRIEGRFAIPDDGLTGMFLLRMESTDKGISLRGNQGFTVSDYKLPTFELKDLQVARGIPSDGDVTISGHVVTYSGFPMSDTKITLDLSVSKRMWWYSTPDNSFYTADTTTDTDGGFSIVLPKELLADAPISDGVFTASLTALSATGESQTGSIRFTQGTTYSIIAAIPDRFDISGDPVSLPVKVTDTMGTSVEQVVNYLLTSDGKEIATGSFAPNNPIVDWSHIPSGLYSIRFSLADSTLATSVTVSDRILYRLADKRPPIDTPLWTPLLSMSGTRGSRIEIPYGTTCGQSHILATVWDQDSVLSREWLTPKPGNHYYSVKLPGDGKGLNVTFATVSDYHFHDATIRITPIDVARSLDMQISSFRDRIIPGEKETWTITVADNLGSSRASAVILDMYAKAIEQLVTPDWNLAFGRYYSSYRFGWNRPSPFDSYNTSAWSPDVNIRQYLISEPDWQLYGKAFVSKRSLTIRGRSTKLAAVSDLKEEAVAVESFMYASNASADMAVADTAEATGAADEDAGTTNNRGDGSNTDSNASYRMPEMPIALFEPMLTTDSKGHLSYSFTAPDANTTWQLCALAFSQDLLSGSLCREIISSKPVMVQPNLPRFLRTGDRAVIRSSVMNNTDTAMVVTSRIDIFEPASGHILYVHDFTDTIAGHCSTVVEATVTAPSDNPLLGFRIRSMSGRYSDGEQALIAILPSSTPVIETEPFYMAPDSTQLSLRLPRMTDDARVTLQFCQNPAWYCVAALPGLITDESRSALTASAAIFSAAVAEGLLKSQPELAKAIHYWLTSDRSDSTLTSMLERNADLKTVLLNATPWVMDARSQTERMTRLALLFDRKEIAATYATNIAMLAKLQRNQGGWAWIEQSPESSVWATTSVLSMMGRLQQLGYLPDNKQLRAMIQQAVSYIDDYYAREFIRHPKVDYTQYVAVRDYFPEIKQSTPAKRVTSATVQRLISDWKSLSAPAKALSAMILNNHGYNATARQAIASLREYAKSTPERGIWWPNLDNYTIWPMGKISATATILDAFNAVEPGSSDIDRIRQWLILQKEAKDWGNSVSTSDAIASILTSGSRWTVPAHGAAITIDDQRIEPSRIDAMTGYLRTDISSLHPSDATLSVVKTPGGPAWGAVYCRYTDSMSDVKAATCDAVSIDKQMLVQRSTAEGMTWEPAADIRLGDRVKAQLTIRVTRDMDYVAVIDDRAAAFEPIEQLPAPIYSDGICFYRENRDASTRMFVTHLPKGTYILTYELFANNAGTYASGIATLQSQYAPQLTAHSAGTYVTVK